MNKINRINGKTVSVRDNHNSLAWLPESGGVKLYVTKLLFVNVNGALISSLSREMIVRLSSESTDMVTEGRPVTVAIARVDENRAKALALTTEQYRGYVAYRRRLEAEGKTNRDDDIVFEVEEPEESSESPEASKHAAKFSPKAPEGVVQTTPIKSDLTASLTETLANCGLVSHDAPVAGEQSSDDATGEPSSDDVALKPKRPRHRGGRGRNKVQGANVAPKTDMGDDSEVPTDLDTLARLELTFNPFAYAFRGRK